MNWEMFKQGVTELVVPHERQPLVVFSGVWGILKNFPTSKNLVQDIVNLLVDLTRGNRLLLMPSFSNGFAEGVCNLDIAPSQNGQISEYFRRLPEAGRSKSAFFSFSCLGPGRDLVCELEPMDAWGDGSLYSWMQDCNARFLTIGVPKTTISFLHRLEWLVMDRISYRERKAFEGKIIRNGHVSPIRETLFVRRLSPVVPINTWQPWEQILLENGMRSISLGRFSISSILAKDIVKTLLPIVEQDPFAFILNKSEVVKAYGSFK